MEQENRNNAQNAGKMPPAETGNASNPSPHNEQLEHVNDHQLLGDRAEKYLRESASPEDYPDEQDWEEAQKIIQDTKEKQ